MQRGVLIAHGGVLIAHGGVLIAHGGVLIAHGAVLIAHGRIDCSSSLSLSSEVFPLSKKRNVSFQPVSMDAWAIKHPCARG